jgi:hypothetical protein
LKKRNRLEKKRLNDLVLVQYNLRLRLNQLLNKRPDLDPIVLDDVDPTSNWVAETHSQEFDVDYDLEVELAGQVQMDADPLLGPCGSIPLSDMAGPSGIAGRRSRIPCVPCRGRTRTTTTSATSERVVTNVPDGDESEVELESESETDVDVEGEDAHAISTSIISDD